MRDVVFKAPAGSLSRIAPVVFGDELFQAALLRMGWKANRLSKNLAPPVTDSPLIPSRLVQPVCPNSMPHRTAGIVLAVYEASGCRNCASGHNLGDENNSSSVFAALFSPNVEAQVYLIEIGMKRNWEAPKKPGAAESKANEAKVCGSVE